MKYLSTMRHVLEIRFYSKQFSFIDQLGITTDKLTRELGLNKVSIKGSRIDIASDNLDKIFFFTVENMGVQLENSNNFEDFKENIEVLRKLVDKNLIEIDTVARIGTKTSALTHGKGKGFDATKQLLMNTVFNSLPSFNESVGIDSNDIGYVMQDGKIDKYKLHSQLGPVRLREAIDRFYDAKVELYDGFGKDGLFVDLDIFDDKIIKEVKVDALFQQVIKQIETSESLHNKLLSYIFEAKTDGR